jgi:ATP-dependent DNA helicase HFM1/MER3
VHVLNESRGSTLEVVVCRMKTRGSGVRFVAVSATVPNIDDVAHWIASRNSNGAAATLQVSWRLYYSRIYINYPE